MEERIQKKVDLFDRAVELFNEIRSKTEEEKYKIISGLIKKHLKDRDFVRYWAIALTSVGLLKVEYMGALNAHLVFALLLADLSKKDNECFFVTGSPLEILTYAFCSFLTSIHNNNNNHKDFMVV